MNDDDYRAILAIKFNTDSSKHLNERQLSQFLGEFFKLGWLPRGHVRTLPEKPKKEVYGCTEPQWRYIKWLQKEMGWNTAQLRGFIKHSAKVDHERFLNPAKARGVISGLRKILWKEFVEAK